MELTQRGRKSAAELTVIGGAGIVTVQRPDPPASLSGEEATEWTAVVNRMPADWFPRETHGLLEAFCAHLITFRALSAAIRRLMEGDFTAKELKELTSQRESESRAMSSLATRLRITQQSSYSADKKRGKTISVPRPWQEG